MRSKRWTLEEFEDIYACFEESGLTPKAFCSNEGIHTDRFYEWRKKLLVKRGEFIPVKINTRGQLRLPVRTNPQFSSAVPVQSQSQSSCEIVYPNGVTVRLNGPVSPEMLRTLILLNQSR
jgi:transposase-like protein